MVDEGILFKEVMFAIDEGNNIKARDLLTRLLRDNKNNPDYWLWMSCVVDSSKERIYCLKEVLKLDAQNLSARRGLILLGVTIPDDNTCSGNQIQKRDWESSLPGVSTLDKIFLSGIWKPAAMTLGGVAIIFLILAWSFISLLIPIITGGEKPKAEAQSVSNNGIISTSVHEFNLPTLSGPTPLVSFLKATYTPTPLYVVTPHPRTENYRSAMRSYQRGEWDDVIDKLGELATLEPDAYDIQYYIGEAYRFQDKNGDAIKAYDRILDNSKFAPAYLGRARARLSVSFNNWKDAQADLNKAIQLDQNLTEAYLELANISIRLEKFDDAKQNLDIFLKLSPDSTMAHYLMAKLFLGLEDYGQAIIEGQKTINLDVTFLEGYRLLGEIYIISGKFGEAERPLQIFTTYVQDDYDALIWLGSAYTANGDDKMALVTISNAISLDDKGYKAYLDRGNIYLHQGQAQLAEGDYTTALDINSSIFEAYIGLGKAQMISGKDNLASYNFDKAQGYTKSDSDIAELYFWRAQSLEKINQPGAAIRDWRALLALPQKSVPAEWITIARNRLNNKPEEISTERPENTNQPTPMPSEAPTRKPTLTPSLTTTHKPTLTEYLTATKKPTLTSSTK